MKIFLRLNKIRVLMSIIFIGSLFVGSQLNASKCEEIRKSLEKVHQEMKYGGVIGKACALPNTSVGHHDPCYDRCVIVNGVNAAANISQSCCIK